MEKELFLKVKDYIKKVGIEELLESCTAVTVGFSGGADSVFLLSFLKELLAESRKPLYAIHLNHMLRGEEADRDQQFCARFCQENGIELFCESVDIRAVSQKNRQGIEECARNERYKLFDKCRKQLAARYSVADHQILTATAHNADDNLETVLFNIARGSGALGLCGIPPVRDGVYIRPLLCLSSLEIREGLTCGGVDFMIDSTNAENEYTRNKIRHGAASVLKEINPMAHNAARRLTEAVRRDEEYFSRLVTELLGTDRKRGQAEFSRLREAPLPLLTRALIRLYSEVAPEGCLSGVHVDDMTDMIKRGAKGQLHLPCRVTVAIDDSVSFFRDPEKTRKKTEPYTALLTEGINGFESLGFFLGIRGMLNTGESSQSDPRECEIHDNVYNSLINISLNNDKIKGTVFVRNRRESDVYFIGGHHRRLKKLFCDRKVPQTARDRLPLVCDDEGILWIPGFPARDGTAYSGEGTEVSIYYYSYEKENW